MKNRKKKRQDGKRGGNLWRWKRKKIQIYCTFPLKTNNLRFMTFQAAYTTLTGAPCRHLLLTCCPSELWICNSPSLRLASAQFPTTSRTGPGRDSIGWLGVLGFTCARARWSFSRNSPRFSRTETLTIALKQNNKTTWKYSKLSIS